MGSVKHPGDRRALRTRESAILGRGLRPGDSWTGEAGGYPKLKQRSDAPPTATGMSGTGGAPARTDTRCILPPPPAVVARSKKIPRPQRSSRPGLWRRGGSTSTGAPRSLPCNKEKGSQSLSQCQSGSGSRFVRTRATASALSSSSSAAGTGTDPPSSGQVRSRRLPSPAAAVLSSLPAPPGPLQPPGPHP